MPVLRTLLASLLVLAAGGATFAAATDGFRAFTSEAARRIEVREHPRALPPVLLETADGGIVDFPGLRGRWLLVEFVYTRCTTFCSAQGSELALLQQRLAGPLADGRVALLSVSFDPAHDDPARLAEYQHHSGARGTGWIAARPTSASGLDALLRAFGVTVIPDGIGGFVHNAAIAVVDPAGRLVAITDWDAPGEAERYVRDRLAP